MDKAGLSRKPKKVAAPWVDDIPEALRDTLEPVGRRRRRLKPGVVTLGLVGLGACAFVTSLWFFSSSLRPNSDSNSLSIVPYNNPAIAQSPAPSNSPVSSPDIIVGQSGHFAYSEAPVKDLQSVVPDGSVKLRKAAAHQLQAMVLAARSSDVDLVPLSGFRSVREQEHVFFDVQVQRGESVMKRAEVSAPPGYSEHHTGYAIDIGDGAVPATNLNPAFDKTAAFRWLQANATRFSFELSFPKDNLQHVSYEPWHWRFVGDRDSLETFYKVKNYKP